MDFAKVVDAASELRNRVAGLVKDAFAAAPAAAQTAASVNNNYMTSVAMLAAFANIATAIERLVSLTNEHAELLRSTAEQVQTGDRQTATRDFNAATILPGRQNA